MYTMLTFLNLAMIFWNFKITYYIILNVLFLYLVYEKSVVESCLQNQQNYQHQFYDKKNSTFTLNSNVKSSKL